MRILATVIGFAALGLLGCSGDGTNPLNSSPTLRGNERNAATPPTAPVAAMLTSEPLTSEPTGVAIWGNRNDPARSLVFVSQGDAGTGAIAALDLAGKLAHRTEDLHAPTALDVQHDFKLGDALVDILVVAEPEKHRVRILKIDAETGKLADISGRNQVFVGKEETTQGVTGLGLYRRKDGAVFAVLNPADGPEVNRIAQYELTANAEGKVDLALVRTFGKAPVGDATPTHDSVAIDDELGFIFVAEPGGIRKFHADPDAKAANTEMAFFATSGFTAPRGGLSVFPTDPKHGFVLSGESTPQSVIHAFPREGSKANGHEHASVATIPSAAKLGTSLDSTALPLGTQFPNGLVAIVSRENKTLSLFDWGQIAQRGNLNASAR